MSAIKVCKERGCPTLLSRFNPGFQCWAHTPDLTQTDRPAEHVKSHMNMSNQGIMSSEFLRGIPGTYAITPEERRHWARGG